MVLDPNVERVWIRHKRSGDGSVKQLELHRDEDKEHHTFDIKHSASFIPDSFSVTFIQERNKVYKPEIRCFHGESQGEHHPHLNLQIQICSDDCAVSMPTL